MKLRKLLSIMSNLYPFTLAAASKSTKNALLVSGVSVSAQSTAAAPILMKHDMLTVKEKGSTVTP